MICVAINRFTHFVGMVLFDAIDRYTHTCGRLRERLPMSQRTRHSLEDIDR